MELNSDIHETRHRADDVHQWLCDLRHLERLMPQDRVSDFRATEENASFKINGLARITLVRGRLEPGKIELLSGEKTPFPFVMTLSIAEKETDSSISIHFKGDANPMMAMMAATPLTNFLNMLCVNLEGAMESD